MAQREYDSTTPTVAVLADLVAGLQAPLSIGVPLGAAERPLRELLRRTGFGWKDSDEIEAWLTRVVEGKVR